jgi:hypothetical protein
MERQEPRFDKDMQGVEFCPRSYRGPSLSSPSRDSDADARRTDAIAAAWAVGRGILRLAVAGALLGRDG